MASLLDVEIADEDEYDAADISEQIAEAADLDSLCAVMRYYPRMESVVDITDLPNYGGTEPASTEGVWSWDATRLLVSDYENSFICVKRPIAEVADDDDC